VTLNPSETQLIDVSTLEWSSARTLTYVDMTGSAPMRFVFSR
jgi:hypothetical protein